MPFTNTIVDGGLDLITAPQAVTPGRLIACNNYEVARQRGIRRMDGYEKYDGGQSPSTGNSILAWTTLQTTNPPFGMQVGDAMHFIVGGYPNQNGTVFFIDSTGAFPVVYVSLLAPLPYNLQALVANPPAGGFAFFDDTTSNAYNILTAGAGAPSTALFPPQNLQAQAVPTSVNSDISYLIPGTTYGYRVTTVNVNGETTPSSEVTVTTSSTVADTATSTIYNPTQGLFFQGITSLALQVGQTIYASDGTNTIIGQIRLYTGNTIDVKLTGGFLVVAGDPANMAAGVQIIISDYIALLWTPSPSVTYVPDPQTYNVYGRTPADELKIANVDIGNGFTIPYYVDLGTITPVGLLPLTNTTGTVGSVIDNLAGNFTAISATIQQVPGQGNVNGIFWLKDLVYATRDYFTMSFTAGNLQPNIGDVMFQGASFGAATWTGSLAKLDVTSGSFGDSNNAAGFMAFYNTSGTHTNAAAVKNHTQSDTSFATFGLQRTATSAGLYVAIGDRGATVPTQSWQWCDIGWTIGYKSGVIDFVDLNVALTELNSSTDQHVTTAWKSPGTVASGGAWNTGAGFLASDVAAPNDSPNYAEWTFFTGSKKNPSQTVTLSNFGFTASDIPLNAAITGVELQMQVGSIGYTGHHTSIPFELTVQFAGVSSGPTPNLASSTPYPIIPVVGSGTIPRASYANYVSGGIFGFTKFWGAPVAPSTTPVQTLGYNLIPPDVTSTAFGVSLAYNIVPDANNQQIQVGIDYVALRFSYIPQQNLVYFWNVGAAAPSAVKAQVVMHYQQGGDLSLSSASGTLYFAFIQSDGSVGGLPARPIGSDEQIRTLTSATPDGGVVDGSLLIALSSTAAGFNTMDWSALLSTGAPQPDGSNAPPSKYQSVTKNFYASSGLAAIYGVSGGGPAFYYDGIRHDSSGNVIPGNFSRILTGLPLQFETPRSIEAHQGHIFLGYYSGVIQWGNGTNVLSFNPALYDGTAGDNGFGDRVIGIKSINGDSLCVWTQSTIQMMQGNFNIPAGSIVTSSLYTTTISPTSGGIEYTIQPMANYMYCDFRGITAIGATQKYGDFELGHYSAVVAPFLIPRVQLSSFFEGPNIGINNSVLIRNKNMARYFFNDGSAMSMTFLEDNEPPQFTIQFYLNSAGVALTWDVVQAFTETLGRDRIFGATADNTGFVYELERANSFNGYPITATASLVPDTAQVPYQNKEFKGINVFGQAQDYASFTLSRSSDYTVPVQATGNNVIDEVFGSLTASPTGNVLPFASLGSAPLSIEGTSIGLRFDSSSAIQFPHLIQAVSYTVGPLQDTEE